MKELFGVFDGLEVLKDSWPGYLGDIRNALFGAGEEAYLENRRRVFEAAAGEPGGGDMAPACGCDQWELWSEQLAVYFVFTYFCGAVYDGRPYEKVKLAVVSTLLITEMMRGRRILQGGRLSLEDAAEAAHRYSREVEHSDHNLRVLERAFLRQPEFRLENLIRLLRP